MQLNSQTLGKLNLEDGRTSDQTILDGKIEKDQKERREKEKEGDENRGGKGGGKSRGRLGTAWHNSPRHTILRER